MNEQTPEGDTQSGLALTSIAGLEHLEGLPEQRDTGAKIRSAAVLYHRVSTVKQTYTAADLDEDGNSIATQRVWTLKKAKALRATVAKEFVEPGQSAQTIAKRPIFREMLRYVEDHPEVRFVIIYMRSRVFRNFTDAAITKRALLEKGVRLVSAKEEFGDGYMADAMEAITDVMNELQVRMSGEDIKVKMAHKVEQGGTVSRAKLGYLNVRKDFEGRLVNSIDLDVVRAPLIRWAFEQYATGHYSINALAAALREQGLTTRPSAKRPASGISNNQLAIILRDPFYTGVIRYKGRLYAGRHEPIISKETSLSVQDVLDRRNRKGDRDRIYLHYLRGLLYCAECDRAGRQSRLVYSLNRGSGGEYEYYICIAHQRGMCSSRNFRIADIERALSRVMSAERIDADALESIRQKVLQDVEQLQGADREVQAALRKQLHSLEAQEDRLVELAAEGLVESSKLKAKLEIVTLQQGQLREQLSRTDARLTLSAAKLDAYLDLFSDPGKLYDSASDEVRRELLLAFFDKLLVGDSEQGVSVEGHRNIANATLRQTLQTLSAESKESSSPKTEGLDRSGTTANHSAISLNKNVLVVYCRFKPASPQTTSFVSSPPTARARPSTRIVLNWSFVVSIDQHDLAHT